ncbi:PDZ domain-containing protein [Dokdonella soli]|uniref:PDZ domain-containing protein n=1 Tax=Dokdonella soli TaxID=529810 RepID=A0ABP3TK68_9GAMM
MNLRRILTLLLFLGLCVPLLSSAADEKGWFGFAVSVETEGFSLNPTLRSIKIEKVIPASPAAAQGLAAGDLVLEVQDTLVAGAKARELQATMHKAVGESLRLKLKRGDAEPYVVTLTAAARPKDA